MTSDLHRPGLHPLSHLKAGATTSSSKSTARPAQPSSQASSRSHISKNNIGRDDQVDATSDKATTTLIRRVLCPQASSSSSLEELLPPLTSSNDVDRQLYALIAIIVKEFVYSWYSKVTSDQILVNELLQVIAHCTRALEQRLRQVDVAQLVLDEVPALVEAHITSYRLAKQQSVLSGLHPSTRTIYHALNPHPSLSPVPDPSHPQSVAQQRENESMYRQLLVHGTLAVLLPTEDLENTCVRTVVGDILADLILGKEISGRVCEGRFLWEAITKLVDISRQKPRDTGRGGGHREDRLRKFGLLPTEEEEQPSGSWLYKTQSRVSAWIWSVLQYVYVTFVALRFVATGLFRIASSPPTPSPRATKGRRPPSKSIPISQRPVFDYRLFGMASELFDMPQRMPWLGGLLALFQHLILAGPGRLGDADGVLDRFLHETIQDYLLTPTLFPRLLLASRTALFPSNAPPPPQGADGIRATTQSQTPGPGPTAPAAVAAAAAAHSHSHSLTSSLVEGWGASVSTSPDGPADLSETAATATATIKRRCAASLLALIPRPIARRFFGSDDRNRHNTNNKDNDQHNNGHTNQDDSQRRQQQNHHHQQQQPEAPPPLPPQTEPIDADADHGHEDDEEDEEALLTTAIENDFLDLLSDQYCNKHLIYSILETVLARLLPELSERSVGELLEDRGISSFLPTPGTTTGTDM